MGVLVADEDVAWRLRREPTIPLSSLWCCGAHAG
jgi:hypothetical protein